MARERTDDNCMLIIIRGHFVVDLLDVRPSLPLLSVPAKIESPTDLRLKDSSAQSNAFIAASVANNSDDVEDHWAPLPGLKRNGAIVSSMEIANHLGSSEPHSQPAMTTSTSVHFASVRKTSDPNCSGTFAETKKDFRLSSDAIYKIVKITVSGRRPTVPGAIAAAHEYKGARWGFIQVNNCDTNPKRPKNSEKSRVATTKFFEDTWSTQPHNHSPRLSEIPTWHKSYLRWKPTKFDTRPPLNLWYPKGVPTNSKARIQIQRCKNFRSPMKTPCRSST